MEEPSSPGGPDEGSVGVNSSPMTNIVSDLSKSTLDSGVTKKRYFQRSRGSSGAHHRTNVQKNEGLAQHVITATSFCKNKMMYSDLVQCTRLLLNPDEPRQFEIQGCEHDKENGGATNNSYNPTPQKTRCIKVRCALGNCELNNCDIDEEKRCEFHVATGTTTPRHMSLEPPYNLMQSPASKISMLPGMRITEANLLRSLSSGYESMDDGLMNELVDMEALDNDTHLPTGISELLSGDIVASESSMDCDASMTPEISQRNFTAAVKGWLSLQNGIHDREDIRTTSPSLLRSSSLTQSPPLSRIRTCLFRSPRGACSPKTITRRFSCEEKSPTSCCVLMEVSPQSGKSSKRPLDEMMEIDDASLLKKQCKSNNFCLDTTPKSANPSILTRPKIPLQRSLSETETHANIKWAIHRSATDSDLTGDFSKPCILPIIMGHHPDLKTITSNTLVALFRGEFDDYVNSYRIVDCRYPYEYNGGHIIGALNLYNMDLIEQSLLNPLSSTVPRIETNTYKRDIIVFHCEFSWERGPNLSRLLRRLDRERNKEYYPALHFPEIYLLHGGYEKFYSEQKEFCSPQDYKPMRHPNHEEEFRFFRSKSKSWQVDKTKGSSQPARLNLKRLGF